MFWKLKKHIINILPGIIKSTEGKWNEFTFLIHWNAIFISCTKKDKLIFKYYFSLSLKEDYKFYFMFFFTLLSVKSFHFDSVSVKNGIEYKYLLYSNWCCNH